MLEASFARSDALPRPTRCNFRAPTWRLVALGATLLVSLAQPAFAQPGAAADNADEMGLFLQDKGLISKLEGQISAASQAASDKASELVVMAMGFLGVQYKRGGNTFDQGLDCSGFVRLLYQQTLGLALPRRSAEQAAATSPIERSELRPGDLVFFNTLRSAFSHVGIYIGDGKFIHSPRSGAVVRVEDMSIPYWTHRFDGARRVNALVAQGSALPPSP